jgi:hypothetical protein
MLSENSCNGLYVCLYTAQNRYIITREQYLFRIFRKHIPHLFHPSFLCVIIGNMSRSLREERPIKFFAIFCNIIGEISFYQFHNLIFQRGDIRNIRTPKRDSQLWKDKWDESSLPKSYHGNSFCERFESRESESF